MSAHVCHEGLVGGGTVRPTAKVQFCICPFPLLRQSGRVSVSCIAQRVLNNLSRTMWDHAFLLAPPPYAPFSRQQVFSLSQSSCVSPDELTGERGGRSQIIKSRESLVFYISFVTLWYSRFCPQHYRRELLKLQGVREEGFISILYNRFFC